MCGACLGTAGTVALPCQIDFWAGRQPLASGFSSPGSRHPQGLPEELLSKYLPRRVCVTTHVCLHVCIFVFVHVCTCPCACIGVCVYCACTHTVCTHVCVCLCVCRASLLLGPPCPSLYGTFSRGHPPVLLTSLPELC